MDTKNSIVIFINGKYNVKYWFKLTRYVDYDIGMEFDSYKKLRKAYLY